MTTQLERDFQKELITTLRNMFPDCYIQKNNANRQQGVPDLLILWNDRWAVLECKRDSSASTRPNQPYYVDKFNKMSFASFIYPENREEVLHALSQALRA